MGDGWIKLHRQIYDNQIVWQSSDPFDRRSAWIDLLLMVNHEPADIMVKNNIIHIERGQTWTSYRKLAERWKWSIGKVRRYATCLEHEKMLTQNAHTDGTLLTVVNYGFYQGERYAIEHTDGTLTERSRNADRLQTRNIKNEKNEKNNTICAKCAEVFAQAWSAYPEKKGKARVSDKDKRKLAEIGIDEVLRAIDRYKKEIESSTYRHYQNGSTFFHSGIYDYLDETYTPTTENETETIHRQNKGNTNSFHNAPERTYDMDELEKQLLGLA